MVKAAWQAQGSIPGPGTEICTSCRHCLHSPKKLGLVGRPLYLFLSQCVFVDGLYCFGETCDLTVIFINVSLDSFVTAPLGFVLLPHLWFLDTQFKCESFLPYPT